MAPSVAALRAEAVDRLLRRRKIGKPDIEPVLLRVTGFRNAERRSAHGADANPFSAPDAEDRGESRVSNAHDAQGPVMVG